MDQAVVQGYEGVDASMPSRSATPVPKLSMATSADFASACTISRPFSDLHVDRRCCACCGWR